MAIPIYTPSKESDEEGQYADHNNNDVEEEDFLVQFVKEILQVYRRFVRRTRRRRRRIASERRSAGANVLPDLVCCHRLPQCNDRIVPDVDVDPSGIGLDIKMIIDSAYGRIGRDLRAVGDSYPSQSYTRPTRRRHPAGSPQSSHIHHTLRPLIDIPCLHPMPQIDLIPRSHK